MPTIKYPKNPNVETAFVEQDDGTRNRAVLTAPQDISTIEYPNNPNSTKAYVTINGKKQRVVMTADIAGGGGSSLPDQTGHSGEFLTTDGTDASWGDPLPDQTGYSGRVLGTDGFVAGWIEPEIIQREVMPQAAQEEANNIYQYIGTTDSNYTNGYFYKCAGTTTYTGTVTFDSATLSASTIACSGDDFATFVAEWGSGDITTITNGTLTYDQSGGLLVFVGKDANSTTVCTFQLYTEDYQDAGFTITGTLQDGDVFAFTCTISSSTTYAWTRIDVQPSPVIPDPLPSQTGNAGKFLTTDGTDASWSDKPLINNTVESWKNTLSILGPTTNNSDCVNIGKNATISGNYHPDSIAIGCNSTANSASSVAIGSAALTSGSPSIAIGHQAKATANFAIQFGYNRINSDANTFKVGNANGNFEIMSADGTIPAARHASLPSADGTYVLKLVISGGVPTLSWVAE